MSKKQEKNEEENVYVDIDETAKVTEYADEDITFIDDEEEEIQVQGGLRAGRAVVGPFRERRSVLQGPAAGRGLLRGVIPVRRTRVLPSIT